MLADACDREWVTPLPSPITRDFCGEPKMIVDLNLHVVKFNFDTIGEVSSFAANYGASYCQAQVDHLNDAVENTLWHDKA